MGTPRDSSKQAGRRRWALLPAAAAAVAAAATAAVFLAPAAVAGTPAKATPKATATAEAGVKASPAAGGKAAPRASAAATGAGLDYVGMGSSFAAGPGIPPAQTGTGAAACARSAVNYASLVAEDIGANLSDASCSGATTANVLTTGQSGQPPQIDAVTSATQLVTVTIGGNDVDYLGSIDSYSCQTSGGSNCGSVDQASINQTFGVLAGRIEDVVNAVHATAPQARVLLVNYFTILPDSGVCTGVPLTADQSAFEHSIASRLAAATATAATATGATLVDLAAASHGHDACAAVPWVETYTPAAGRSQYHPNEAGMRGAATLVESALAAAGQTRTGPVTSGIPGKCVDVENSGTTNGTHVQLYGCDGTGAQNWTVVPGAGGTLRALGGCMDVSASGTANGTLVQWWQCNGSGAQRWLAGPNGSLVNPESGRCLDDPNSSTADWTQLRIWDCNGTAAQNWTLPS
ncbi:Ricin-type beta-trefoil lectin domain-containing protein [Actinacidiphila yanglinensis]|uniref:Ricin-type beta-trefoil lectin domain-containing protein n=1 Tax=Actinacidiphila yanglinensis TaxID=310779 RepID=A0A1H5TZB2_9ACTN|nr:SGNH/GDSL hydrolase family protein [Actinacidiphila yanglinensis]SEF67347.1 Ricin-type beta-trefoil lectin domain-containing protein [Actinacidiphila yanglinensis]